MAAGILEGMRFSALGVVVWVVGCSAAPAPATQKNVDVDVHVDVGDDQHESVHDHVHVHDQQAQAQGLVRIADSSHICMLSNRFLGEKPHVPIDVEGKTYFGCCANCAARLGERPDARVAVDPVNGHTLDKAKAILARDATNKVLYFESEETFAQMQRSR